MLRAVTSSFGLVSRSSSVARFLSTAAIRSSSQTSSKSDTSELEDLFYDSQTQKQQLDSKESRPFDSEAARGQRKRSMWGINRVELLGGVGTDPEFSTTRNGDSYASLKLYTNVDYFKRGGERVEQREMHDVQVFTPSLVDYLKKNVKKGSRVYVSGRIHYLERADTTRRAIVKADIIQCIAKSNFNNDGGLQ